MTLIIKAARPKREAKRKGKIKPPNPVNPINPVIPTPFSVPILDFRYGMVTGPAGSGKTYRIRKILEADASWGLVTATTGVAARILGPKVPTINSALGFFDLDSLLRAAQDGTLRRNIKTLRKKYDRIIIDEASMLSAEMFTLILAACESEDMGLIISGDFLQLPPITKDFKKPAWLFYSKHWPQFSTNITRLKTQYRHTNDDFIQGLNYLRAGRGGDALPYLQKAGVTFPPVPTIEAPDTFDGVVLVATNNAKDNIDRRRYAEIDSKEVTYNTERWGRQKKEWGEIDDAVSLKVGCRVMILRNLYEDQNGKTTLTQANGETGAVIDLTPLYVSVQRDDGSVVIVAMQKTDDAVRRTILQGDDSRQTETTQKATGGVEYMPLCRAFALTVHKAQGLTIATPTQIPLWQGDFWKTPAMVYVAASRVKNPGDLSIVGADMLWAEDKPLLEEQCTMDLACRAWI